MLTVSQLSKSFSGRVLFEEVSLQVNRGDRIGLVGPNGAGKSTLFSLLLGDISPDSGTIAIEKNATIGFLPQETAAAGDETVLELAMAVSPELVQAQKVIKQHEAAVAGIADPGADAAYHNALHVFDEHGGWELEPKAKRVLAGLAFREADFDRPARALSGGWIMRAHLARLLVMQPDLLLLDEPSRSRIAAMVSGISEKLSGRDRHDLARSRVFESTCRQHRRDRTLETHPVSRRLGQLRRTESRARRTTARRL
jgi:ATP-binding cassette subfamily F protein 3